MFDYTVILAAASGLVLFLFGMEQFSREVQLVSGERFRSFIRKATDNPLKGAFLGASVTTIAQSSTAVAIISLGLIDSGLLSFTQSLSIFLGAGIGSTITAQLIALKITAMAPIFMLLGFAISVLGGRYKFIGRPIFFFGIVFFGMSLISDAMAPLKEDPAFIGALAAISSYPIALLAGFIVTNIFQSSGVSTGLIVVLAGSSLLSPDIAIALILGCNIGTITPLVSSIQLGLWARRAAMAQFLFNLVGVLILLPFIPQFTQFVMSLGGDAGQQAANANTISNIIAAGVFILILKPFGDLIIRMVPGKEEEILFQTVSLDGKLSPDNQEAFKMIEKELQHLLSNTGRVMDDASLLLCGKDGMAFRRLTKREALDDFLDERIEQAIVEITERPLNQKEAMQAVLLVRMSNALEQVSDLGMSIGYAARHMDAKGEQLSIEAIEEINSVQSRLREDLAIIAKRFPNISQEDVVFMKQNDEKMREQINKSYSKHLVRLSVKSYSPGTYVKCLSRLEAAHSKLREIRKLTEQYSAM